MNIFIQKNIFENFVYKMSAILLQQYPMRFWLQPLCTEEHIFSRGMFLRHLIYRLLQWKKGRAEAAISQGRAKVKGVGWQNLWILFVGLDPSKQARLGHVVYEKNLNSMRPGSTCLTHWPLGDSNEILDEQFSS